MDQAVDPFDSKQFRQVCGQFLTGVTVVTATLPDGRPTGLTANSFTSVSLDPPLVLVCVDKNIGSYAAFRAGAYYAVHILSDRQEELSARFAQKGLDKFAGLPFGQGLGGVPVFDDCLARMECRIVGVHDAGDHGIFVGQVERIELADEAAPPLGFFRGRYTHIVGN